MNMYLLSEKKMYKNKYSKKTDHINFAKLEGVAILQMLGNSFSF